MKNSSRKNKTTQYLFNTWSSPLQKIYQTSTFCPNSIYLQRNTRSFLLLSLSNNFSSQLLKEKKNLYNVYKVNQKVLAGGKTFPFFNRSFDKKRLKMLFSWYYANRGEAYTFSLVEKIQKLGFTYAMKAGISLGVDDLKVPPCKGESLKEAVELLANTKASVNSGNVTALEEFQQFVDTWHRTSENLKTSVVQNFSRNLIKKEKNLNQNNFSSGRLEETKSFKDLRNKKSKEIPNILVKNYSSKKYKVSSSPFFEDKLSLLFSKNSVNSPPDLEKQFLADNNLSKFLKGRPPYQNPAGTNFESSKQKAKAKASYSTILNPVYMMAFSGARGNLSQVRQLVGMRGLMADPQGQLVEFPIQSNFREGLTVTEYMISCYGARKGLVDTALRTAAAGYLTRRLVDVSHHQIVRFVTCGTKGGILLSGNSKKEQNKDNLLPSAWKVPPYGNLKRNKNSLNNYFLNQKQQSKTNPLLHKTKEKVLVKKPLVFMVGRVLARDIPGYAFRNQEIDISLANSPLLRKVYETIGIYIRSPLTCKSEAGVCQLCYGWSVSANRLVGLGEAVGIIAAQSIGEPGTQLTMRTFHTGGVFSGDIMEECRAKHAGVVFFPNVYLGLLVRTAGGAIAFCLKTPATFQIKSVTEITTYTVSANTLLFVRQGEKVIMDGLLAQIPNLPTIEESTGFSYKTIVSNLSGEVRQKATVNPELASIRILAGQECKQFYFFNSFHMLALNSKQSKNVKNYPLYSQKQLISTNSLNNRLSKKIGENNKQNHDLYSVQNKRLAFQQSENDIKQYKNKGLVNLIWGSHRLGNNQSFSININGSTSEVVLTQRDIKRDSLQESLLSNGLDKNFTFFQGLENSTEQLFAIKQVSQKIKIALLVDLRFFVANKIHQNKFTGNKNFFLKKDQKVLSSKIMLYGASAKAKKSKASKPVESKLSPALCMHREKHNKNQLVNSGFLKLLVYKTKTSQKNILFFPSIETFQNLKSRNSFLYYGNAQEKKDKLICFYKEHLLNPKVLKLKDVFVGSKTPKQGKQMFSFFLWGASAGILNHLTNTTAIKKNTFDVWPEFKAPQIDYAYLFWKLKDLVFFRSNFTKKGKQIKNGTQYRVSINQHWWGNKTQNYLLSKTIKASKGHKLINFNQSPLILPIIKEFPYLILKLFSRFNIENCLNKKISSKIIKTKALESPCFTDFSSQKRLITRIGKRLKFQDSGEIFPLQGNTNLEDFQKTYRSAKNITGLNSGLLIHYNRISYKTPSAKGTNAYLYPSLDQTNIKISSQIKKQLSFFRSPQIGDFINTGDEVIKECASAYCGQIIEKSPVALTLRLTQNILYSNYRNRPAKINKSVKNGNWVGKGAPLVTLPYSSNVTGDIVAGIPKIEQLFEARGEALDETVEKIWTSIKLSIVPRSKAVRECFKEIGLFVVAAIQKVYSSQGVHIADKHLEVIIRQMTRRALIVDPGDTEFLPEEFVDLNTIECVNWATYGNNAIYRPRLIGITKASLTSNSFLSSASFQQTARVLERETVLEKTDRLLGLKERVMMGALINAGTGELKTSIRLSDRSLAKSLSSKLLHRLSFFSRRKIEMNQNNKILDKK